MFSSVFLAISLETMKIVSLSILSAIGLLILACIVWIAVGVFKRREKEEEALPDVFEMETTEKDNEDKESLPSIFEIDEDYDEGFDEDNEASEILKGIKNASGAHTAPKDKKRFFKRN